MNGLCFTALFFFFFHHLFLPIFLSSFFFLLAVCHWIDVMFCAFPFCLSYTVFSCFLCCVSCYAMFFFFFFPDFWVCTLQTLWLGVLYMHTHIMLGGLISSGPCNIKLYQSPNLCNWEMGHFCRVTTVKSRLHNGNDDFHQFMHNPLFQILRLPNLLFANSFCFFTSQYCRDETYPLFLLSWYCE